MPPATSSGPRTTFRSAGSLRRLSADLVWTLVRTDFKARYHGTIGGFLWALLKPLFMFASLGAVFSFIFPAEPSYKRDLLVGLFLWDFFSESTRTGLVALQQKGFLLTKAKFPSWVIVVTSISNPLITLSVFSVALLAFLFGTGGTPGPLALALFSAYLALFVLVVVGISLATSTLFLRYRDLNQVWDVVTQAGFFLAPIIWPIGSIPERFHGYLYLWPPTPFIDFTRQVLIAQTIPSARAHLLLGVGSLLIFAGGLLVFRRLAPRAAEYV